MRIAWRRIAAATHPDRDDGGDPDRFALAASAYTELRTGLGKNEARAALAGSTPAGFEIAVRIGPGWLAWLSLRRGGAVRLLVRLAFAVAAAVLGGIAAGWGSRAAPALVVGALTWFLAGIVRSAWVGAGRDRPGRVE